MPKGCIHIGIEQLKTNFSQRGKKDLEDADDNHLNGVFGTIICEHTLHAASGAQKAVFFRNEYPIIQQYYNPIKKLDRMTVELLKETGAAATTTETCLIFRFVCKKRNLAF